MSDSPSEKFAEAKRLNDEAVERFEKVRDDAHAKLKEAQTSEEHVAIYAEAIRKERAAIEQLHQAALLHREAMDEKARKGHGLEEGGER